MTRPVPPKKNPLLRTRVPLLPPQPRSLRAQDLAAAAALGRFALQRCSGCGTVLYPARDACPECLGQDLPLTDIAAGGQLLSETVIHSTADPYFRRLTPIRQGLIRSDAGPTLIAFLHRACPPDGRVRLSLRLDRGGQVVVFAYPEKTPGPEDEEDPILRELTADPRHARVLLTDGRHPASPAICRALLDAGAAGVCVGLAERWKPSPQIDTLGAMAGVELIDLDPRDERSVTEAAADLGGRTELIIHSGFHYRPGALFDGGGALRIKDMMEGGALGMVRLAEAFGPALMGRGADGDRPALAWVNLLSLTAQMASPEAALYSAAQAAELSVSQSLRATLRQGGIRVVNVFHGALDIDWFEQVPPPKLGVTALAKGVVNALRQGLEDAYLGPKAEDFRDRLARNPKEVERSRWM
ncbi:SDR family oxidoreductase [Pseudooceanicola sp. C21-150M6]|uniref:SDR family oxidoreductase n=1 Tax=Pseudooceanicola sp. C21-150M6 TaxID=3434355 RepID=UPI003D7FEF72